MSESVTWQKKTLFGGLKEFESLKSLAQNIATGSRAAADLVSAGVTAGKAFVLANVNPAMLATIAICDQVIAYIENIEQAGFYFTSVHPWMSGIGTLDTTSYHYKLAPSVILDVFSAACVDKGDENRPQFNDSAEVGAIVIVLGTGSVDLFGPLIEAYGKLFDIQEWIDLKEDLEKIWTPYDPETIEVSSVPPDFVSFRFAEKFPLVGDGLKKIKAIAQGIKSPAEASLKSSDRLAAFLEKKAGYITDGIDEFADNLETAISIAESQGVYMLHIPVATGGISRIRSLMTGSASQLPSELVYSAGALFIAGGDSMPVIEEVML